MTVRVVLADDEPLLRAGLRLLLDTEPDLDVVGEAGDGAEALDVVAGLRPDVLVLDLRMPVLDGVGVLHRLRDVDDPPAVLVLTVFDDDRAVTAALRAGASGYVLKSSRPEQLLAAVRTTAAGDSALSPAVLRLLVAGSGGAAPGLVERLTEREAEVLRLLAAGAADPDIAAALHLAPGSVKTYVHRVVRKLGVRTRVQAVAVAFDAGLGPRRR